MKKTLILALCLTLCAVACAECAFPSILDPGADASMPGGWSTLTVMGRSLELDFDDDPEYSYLEDGFIQASFYVETPEGILYELYLVYPEDAVAGVEITTQSSLLQGQTRSAVYLFITDDNAEIYALASQSEGPEPAGSDYSIRFDAVSDAGANRFFSGHFDATLMVVDDAYNPLYPLEGVAGDFQFTFERTGPSSDAPGIPALPEAPDAPGTPAPSEAPDAPGTPGFPQTPDASEEPVFPVVPGFPGFPDSTPSPWHPGMTPPPEARKI